MYVEPDLVQGLHLLVMQFYGANARCSFEVVLHHLYQGMCFGLSKFMNKVHTDTSGCLWPGKHTKQDSSAAMRNWLRWHIMYCTAAAVMLVIWYAPEAIQMVSLSATRKITVNHTWFTTVLSSTTFYHCVSWPLHQMRELTSLFFNLTVYLMPYLLSFGMCLADCQICILYIHFFVLL